MRVATSMLFQQGVADMTRIQQQLARTQSQLGSGLRIQTAADDPAAAATALTLEQALSGLSQYRANVDSARHRLMLEETALGGVGDLLQRVRELALQANGGTLTAADRAHVATELRQLREQLLALANSDDGQGRYLFGGSADGAAPFGLLASGGVAYGGDQQRRTIAIGAARELADGDPGSEVFLRLRNGNGSFAVSASSGNSGSGILARSRVSDAALWDGGSYTLSFSGGNYEVRDAANTVVASGAHSPGGAIRFRGIEVAIGGTPADGDSFSIAGSTQQDLFGVIDGFIALAEADASSAALRAQQQTAFHEALSALGRGEQHVNGIRASIGTRLGALDSAETQLDSQKLQAQEALSGLRDLDYAEAASRLNLQLTTLQAAQQSFLRVQGLSLFDYLS